MTPGKHLDQRTRNMTAEELRAMLHYLLGYVAKSDSQTVDLINQAAAISEFQEAA